MNPCLYGRDFLFGSNSPNKQLNSLKISYSEDISVNRHVENYLIV